MVGISPSLLGDDQRVGDVELLIESGYIGGFGLHGHSDDLHIGILGREFTEVGDLVEAGSAPGGPEIEHHHLTSELR